MMRPSTIPQYLHPVNYLTTSIWLECYHMQCGRSILSLYLYLSTLLHQEFAI